MGMNLLLRRPAFGALLTVSAALVSGVASAQFPGAVTSTPGAAPSMTVKEISSRIGLDRKDGEQVATGAILRDDNGREVRLGDLIKDRPTLLMPMFFRCQTACALESDNLLKMLIKEETQNAVRRMAASENPGLASELARKKHMLVGRDLNIIFLSIHPKETPDLTKARRALVTSAFDMGWEKLNVEDRTAKLRTLNSGFHYLTGSPEEVKKVTDSIGFRWFYYESKDQMNHVAASAVLTPTGKITTYITGTEYPTRVLASAVDLAEKEGIAPVGDTFLLGCIMVDPVTGKRTLVFNRIVMVGCFLTLGVLGASILVMNRRYPDRVKVSDIVGDRNSSNPEKGGDGAA